MHITRFGNAPPYQAPGHFDMSMRRLQGMDAGPSQSVWMGHSILAPGGHTTLNASSLEKFYLCLEGTVEVSAQRPDEPVQTVILGPMDSCRIAPHEARQLYNRGDSPARLLLVMPLQEASIP